MRNTRTPDRTARGVTINLRADAATRNMGCEGAAARRWRREID